MLLVKCHIAVSPIHGLGVFLLEPVKAGTVIWRFDESIDHIFTIEEMGRLPIAQQETVMHYGYFTMYGWVLCGDMAVLMNHDNKPNTEARYETGPHGEDVALTDLPANIELTCDYREWDLDAPYKLDYNAQLEG